MAENDAIEILSDLKTDILNNGIWNVAESPDNHSKAWHGVWILQNAIRYLRNEKLVYEIYTPIFTR